METSAQGMRALWISLAVLGVTALIQAAVAAVSGSVALLGDTLHNAADALTAVPLGVAFILGRRPPTRRYTYGYGRAEDLAGIAIVLAIAASSALAAYEAISRLVHPHPVSDLIAVAAAALIGFTGNEVVAGYRIRTGRKIGSAALVADGLHARTDGLTSIAVLAGAGGVAPGWSWATQPPDCSSPWPSWPSCARPPARSTGASWTPSTPPSPARPSKPCISPREFWTPGRSAGAGSTTSAPSAKSSPTRHHRHPGPPDRRQRRTQPPPCHPPPGRSARPRRPQAHDGAGHHHIPASHHQALPSAAPNTSGNVS